MHARARARTQPKPKARKLQEKQPHSVNKQMHYGFISYRNGGLMDARVGVVK